MIDRPDPHLDPSVAAGYDKASAARFAPDELGPTVDLLAELAGRDPALEFAIGTGRVALSLAGRGVEVHGIDQSEPMVAQLRAKPGGQSVPITIGDMTTDQVPGAGGFGLVFLVFNTIGNVRTQRAQVACFQNAATHLRRGGRFVVEVGVPSLTSLRPGQVARPFAVTDDYVGFDKVIDATTQTAASHHWRIEGDVATRNVCPYRWVWPSELDLMAQIAGLEFEARWADWRRTPFDASSRRHVSVWRRS